MKMALAIALFFGIASFADAVVECLMLDAGSAVYAGATTDASATSKPAFPRCLFGSLDGRLGPTRWELHFYGAAAQD
jgi:hypothetical protein